jgi:hypothetical protein
MSQKLLIGAAVLAGGVYLYDQNVSPVFPKENVRDKGKYEYEKAEANARQYGDKLTGTINQASRELSQKTSELAKSVEQSDLYQKAKQQSSEIIESTKKYGKFVDDKVNEEEKTPFVRAVHGYLDKVNEWAGATPVDVDSRQLKYEGIEAPKSWWDSIFGSKKEEVKDFSNDVKKDAKATTDSWLSWGSKKADDVSREAEKQADAASKEYYKQKKSLDSSYNDLKSSARDTFEQQKQSAIAAYESARKEFDDLSARLSGPEKQAKLEKAKEDLNNAFTNLKSFGDDVVTEINKKFK